MTTFDRPSVPARVSSALKQLGLSVGLSVGCLGCFFFQLTSGAAVEAHTALVTGRVTAAPRNPGRVYVVQFSTERKGPKRRGAERLPPKVSEYAFFVDPDQHHSVVAFQDTNGDRIWEPGEPAGALLDGVDVLPDHILSLLAIWLEAGYRPPPEYDLDLRGEHFEANPEFARGEVTTLDNPLFAPARAADGMWAPIATARKTGFGIYFLELYDPHKTPVLFIPGLQGSPRDFAPLISALDATRYQAWVAFYPSGERLAVTSHLLHDVLLELVDRLQPRRIAVVAHSMGGLVARDLMLQLSEDRRAEVVRPFITISTPYGGFGAASAAMATAPTVIPAWIDMRPGSEFLELLQRPLAPQLPFYLFFGTGEHSQMLSTDNDGLVQVSSELADFAQESALHSYGFPAGHVSILSDPEMLRRLRCLLADPPTPPGPFLSRSGSNASAMEPGRGDQGKLSQDCQDPVDQKPIQHVEASH